jgi:pilus assembly protein FimV
MSKEATSVRFGLTFKRSTIGGAAALAFAATPAYSLTLGEAEVMSGLNQKFQAEIDLGAVSPGELGGLSVGVASYADYQRANMEAGGVERDFRFEIVGQGNDAAIQITSDNLISEPLVVFLLEARWQRGRLLREYAIFLDPIDLDEERQYAPRVAEPEVAPLPEPEIIAELSPKPSDAEIGRTPLRAPVSSPIHPDALPELPYHYGPVKKGVSGIQVATELAQGTVLTAEQMLMALFEVNPVAFHGNVNGLDAGFVLRIPDAVDIASINSEVASEEISRHNSAWRRHVSKGGGNKVAVPPLSVAEAQQDDAELSSASQESTDDDLDDEFADEDEGSAALDSDADASAAGNDADGALDEDDVSEAVSDFEEASAEDRLELVAPDDGNDEDTALAETSTSSNPEVAAAEAESASLRVENSKLREQLTETESLLLDIRALLIARSDELSDLKARIARLEGGGQGSGDYSDELEVVSAPLSQGGDSAESGGTSDDGLEPTSSAGESTSAVPKPKPSAPQAPNQANGASASDNIGSKISKTYDSVLLSVISIGWLILLPLILLLLIIVLFLVRRRKKDDESEFEVTASSVDEIETESEAKSDFAERDDGHDSSYAAPGMEVSTGSMEDFGDDFVDELAKEELHEKQEDDDEFDDLDDSVILDDESDEDIAELDGFDIDDEVAEDIDVLALAIDDDAADDEGLEVSTADPEDDDLLSFDESDYQTPKEPEAPVEMDATEDDLDFDLGDFEMSNPESAAEVALDMPADDVDEDFGLDDSAADSGALESSLASVELDDEAKAPEADDASSLDDLVIDSRTRDELVEVDSSDADFDLDPDLDDQIESLSSDDAAALGAKTPSVEATPASGDADEDIAAFAGGDQANTKLDLARAYMEMGDDDEARSLLQEVIAEADGPTKAEAEAALAEIG